MRKDIFVKGHIKNHQLKKLSPEELMDLAIDWQHTADQGSLENPDRALEWSDELFSLALQRESEISDLPEIAY